jgi:hypothetical protein
VGSGETLPGAAALLVLVTDTGASAGATGPPAWIGAEVEALVDGGGGTVSAALSAATAPAGDGVLKAVPSMPAITTTPATPAASAARRARARLRA